MSIPLIVFKGPGSIQVYVVHASMPIYVHLFPQTGCGANKKTIKLDSHGTHCITAHDYGTIFSFSWTTRNIIQD